MSNETLYERLGGEPAIGAIVSEFYDRVLADDRVNHYFDDVDMADQALAPDEVPERRHRRPDPVRGRGDGDRTRGAGDHRRGVRDRRDPPRRRAARVRRRGRRPRGRHGGGLRVRGGRRRPASGRVARPASGRVTAGQGSPPSDSCSEPASPRSRRRRLS
ncbi:globin [Halorubrum distributum JCM 9100]|uniref:Globin n=2 Tax=Halorubrum distributum TaxID=29283 RepID=M0EDA6_9EURY|nr:globin [Halorubrum distributum JCM 9100]ELZ53571.1 globin [Halorubrum distributum JCM 10118]